PVADVHGEASDVVAHDLDLTRVQPDAHLQAQLPSAVAYRLGAADRARRPVERREQSVADRLDLAAREAFELTADHGVVAREEIAPSTVTELPHHVAGVHDVAEQDRREHRGAVAL